ncbi:MAG: hypothetical protein AVDCRST_MAG59-3525, partial [uncultured Thermomicrobiales bacterium]
ADWHCRRGLDGPRAHHGLAEQRAARHGRRRRRRLLRARTPPGRNAAGRRCPHLRGPPGDALRRRDRCRRHLPAPPPPHPGHPPGRPRRRGDPLREAGLHDARRRGDHRGDAGRDRRHLHGRPQPALPAQPGRSQAAARQRRARPSVRDPLDRGGPEPWLRHRQGADRPRRRREPLGLAGGQGEDGRRRGARHRLARHLPPAGARRRAADRGRRDDRPLPRQTARRRGHRGGHGPLRLRRDWRDSDQLGVRPGRWLALRSRRPARQPGRLANPPRPPVARLDGGGRDRERTGAHLHRRGRPFPRCRPARRPLAGDLRRRGAGAPGDDGHLCLGRAEADHRAPRGPGRARRAGGV